MPLPSCPTCGGKAAERWAVPGTAVPDRFDRPPNRQCPDPCPARAQDALEAVHGDAELFGTCPVCALDVPDHESACPYAALLAALEPKEERKT